MRNTVVNRLKTAIESTEILDSIPSLSVQRLCELVELAYTLYGKAEPKISYDGTYIPQEQLIVGACINVSLFAHLSEIGEVNEYESIWHIDLFAQEIMRMYVLLLEFETEINTSEWWDDANEYGLTSYEQASNYYKTGQV